MIKATNTLKPRYHSPLHAEVYRLAIVLLYTTGLRRGELVCLKVGDYDPHAQTLLVRESKFHKSRYLPLSSDTAQETERYLQARRRRHLSVAAETPLVWRGYGKGFTGQSIWYGLHDLFRIANIRAPDGRLPRVHDIRHSFAVNALLRWYRNGSDPQAKLPLLSTYLGHVSVVSTQRYLHFVDELAKESSARFASRYGMLVRPLSEPAGDEQ
ncbi:MAG: tyrosine-type recombinase/integrase [gamma proteobacterium endosymbiont of Lamellibrachia anaximandri]|nr:tyrosine-type recombinase/integrase [gamma proteobacterium endosymbiont of Lamellibrachia anaximandri]MBL3535704.1 tyrosine-type recombinase/integrase [gamma proteobacterium endosymbiont of Lamellibrachia anaximandri]